MYLMTEKMYPDVSHELPLDSIESTQELIKRV